MKNKNCLFCRHTLQIIISMLLVLPVMRLAAASFTNGNLVVLQAASSSANNTTCSVIELDTINTSQTPSNIIAIDGTGANALRISGSASSTGYLSRTNDGSLIIFTGANNTNTSSNVNTLNPRGIGTLSPSGTFALQTTYTGTSGNQTRSATSLDNATWFIADQGGAYSNGTSSASPADNLRAIRAFGGTVYVCRSSATLAPVSTLSAATGGTITALPGLPLGASTVQDFYLISSGDNGTAYDVLYVLSATTATAGTIQKYSLVSGSWTANGSYTTAFGGFSLAAADNGSGALLYVTTGTGATAANSVVKVADTAGYNASINVVTANNVTLYTTAASTVVKGVAFAPSAPVSAPSFATHPASQSISSGSTATMSVSVNGNPSPTFQWYQGASGDTSTPVGGATSSSFTTPALSATTSYWVRATNSQGTADSNTATITVTQSPAITTQPVNQTIVSGGTVTLSVVATGIPSPTYQWYEGAAGVTTSPVSGATSASLTSAALSAGTSFWVRATNASGSADSSAAAVTVVSASPISGTNRNILIPNTGSWSTGGVTLNGSTFINLGLQGVGRIPASAKDAVTGESLGSISDMQVTAWKKNVDGSYSGTFHFLPDRGYNSGVIFSNYAARINTFDFTFTPYTAAGSTTAQDQIAMTFTGSTRFTYNNGSANIFTTGTLANGSATLFGTLNPITTGASTQSDGTYSNRLTADTEGLVLDRRPGKSGQGWIGDEYGASIYHFNASKQIDGQVILPPVYVPHSPVGTTNFAGTPTNGRRDNQGMEGLAQSPDGTKLFGLMQSALVHDSLTGNQGRFNTRLLVYDISSTDTPSDPIAQYVIQLPVADDTGSTTNGTTVNRNCAQSSILALNDHQILILARDGNGRGASGTPVFKSILLADLNGATNIDGTYDAEGNTILSGGALNPAITPLSWTEALNMIGKLGTATAAEVAKFGLNLNTAPGDINSICEKWEALALAPANDAPNPNDYFLFVGNDNDFITATGKYLDSTGTLQSYDAGLENDTIVLAWRVRMTGSDNQAPFVANNIPDQTATELSAFSFTFDAGTFADPESTTLTYTATKADDSPLPAWLSFNAGTRTFSGTPSLADVGTLNVKVTATDSGTPTLSVSAPFTITVGAAPASFSFASATYSVVESAGNVTLTINRAGGQGATSIHVSTTDGTALAGTDYTAQSNVAVNFAANQASATIDVPVVNRSGINASRSFTAALSGGTTTAPATTTVTITESESSFAFSASTASVSEAAGNVVLTINRTGRTDVANAVSVTTSNGTAIAGTDYTAQSGVVVNFAINDTSKTISIPVTNRPGIRPSRTFSAALSVSGSPLLTGTPSSSTVTITEADTFGAMTGPSSSKTPYVQPLLSNWQTTALLSVGDQVTVSANAGSTPLVSGKYEMAGIPDGLGAFDNGDGTFTLLMHHELNTTVGVTRAHGSIGAFISEWIINKSTLQVVSGSDLIRSIYGWNTGTQSSNAVAGTFVFNRFCSADLPAPSALYNAATGLGTQERVFLGGEESGSNGWALATVASGANKGSSYLLGKFNLTTNGSGLTGVGGWENLLASPFAQDKTVVIGTNDGGTGIMSNSVAVYVGTKTNTGSEADKAGLTNGTLKFVNVTGSTAEIANTTTRATNITSGTAFTLSGTSSTVFSRPEDGAWDPTTPGRFYFVTTDRIDQVNDGVGSQIGRTRLWRLNFTDITNPDLGGTIDLVVTGGVGNDANMWDNMCVTADGKIVLQEDVGGAAHNGKVWFYDPATNTLTKVLKHDISRFGDVVSGTVTAATAPFSNDEETSGVIDVTAIFGGNAVIGNRYYLMVDQAHYTTGITAAQVEGGQLLLVRQTSTSSSLSTTTTPYLLPLDASYSTKSLLAVGDQVTVSANAGSTPLVSGKYEMAGIPDGLGAFDNGDGTLTLLMHHELNNAVGVTRAHGSIGAFISEWIINKSTLQVVSGSDLIRNVYGWNTGTQSSNAVAGTFVFNRFCSADLPAPSALYNATTGLGTQERVFLGGEESGSNGWALATVASGANKGSSYLLGKFNLTTNGSGLTGVGGWENLLASPFAQDKTVVIGTNDGGTGIMANAVAVYVGTKTNSGSEADKAGLTNGTLKFVNVTGSTAEIVNTTTRATNITSGTAFTLSGTSSTVFSRPEDGAWDPTTPGRFYFVTTDRIDQVNDGVGSQIGRTRLWRLNFTDITNPDLGGTIDLVVTGGVGNDANMWDNMCVAYDGKVMLQEDVGGAAHNGKIWSYDPVTNTLTKVVTHDPARFGDILPGGTVLPAVSPFSNDEESSGIIDVTSLLGGNAAAGEHIYFTVCQAHYTTGITAAQVEGGQLLVIRETPRVAFSLAASTNTVNENAGSVTLTVNRYGDLQFGGTATVTTANGTALAGTDYTALSAAPLSFLPGETSKTINVTIANRLGLGSATRTFTARVAGEATGTPALTTVTINSVAPPTVSIANASVAEGNAGTSTLSLNVTRSDTSTAFTVNYAVTGGTATSGTDYVLTPGTLTFASGGPATQTIDITVNGDTTIESNENVLVTLSGIVNTTGTTVLGTAVGTGTITNDDTVPNSFPASGTITSTVKGSIGLSGAEIPAFDPVSKRAFASSNNGIQVVNLTNPTSPAFITVIAPSSLGVSGLASNDVSSVAVRKGSGSNPSILAAGIISVPKTSPGYVVFLNAATGALIGSTQVGANPDHIAFTPDGTKLLVANEGETAGNVNLDTTLGSVSIIAVDAAGVPGATQTADFTAYDAPATITALRAAGVRIFQGGVPSTDFEPEYFAVTADNTKALVTLQEANAIAVLDLATATFTSVVPLGKKNFSSGRHDFSDRDGVTAAGAATTLINPTTGNPVFGLYMPDGIASYTSGGQSYFVTANEGDDRNDFITPAETTTVSNAAYVLDPTVFPNATTLKNQARLGRLTVCNAPGLRGDTDNDGDIDEILSYGGRSFSILDAAGNIIFDSGDMIENIVASQFPANFDDTRSDNKGPEPEGVTIATLGARTYAFIGLERSHMTLMFDVTNPAAVTFTGGFVRSGDLNPEGLVFVSAADSPSGKPLLLQASEVSNTLTVFEINQTTDYTLQVLHYYGESGLLGIQTAPIMGAMIDRFDDQYANTLVLAEGDSFIPGPWLIAGADPSLSAVAGIGSTALGRPDFAIMNAFGTDASALGNHEFDLGSPVLSGAFFPSGAWGGAQFPFITANLDFTGDSSLKGRADTTLGGTGGAIAGSETTAIKAKIAPYAVQTISGQKVGIVGATTWDLLTKTSPNGTVPKDDANAATSDLQEVAAYLQGAINSLQGLGVNKIILVDQLDTLQRNKDLAGLVSGIDIMVAGGGHERMGDANDVAVGFNGHDADFIADAYPIVTAGADGKPTLIVTTDTEFTYLGRLVVDFDADGVLILPNLNNTINGAYASTEASLQAAYATTSPAATIIAGSTIGTAVQNITNALNSIVVAKDSSVYGYTDVYLEGDRVFGRTQEVNQGNITADANAWKARTALGLSATDAVFSLKNGGGIRASLGSVLADGTKVAPLANPITGKPAKGISLLDIENALRFDNKLMAFDTTPAGLLAILNYAAGLSSGPTVQNGGYPQVGNIRFSYDSSLPAGSKVRSVALVNDAGHITARIVENGAVLSSAPATIACVSLNFTANGGDGYPIKANADNFRYLLTDGTLSAPVSEALDFTAAANVPANALGEQKAFSDYLVYRHPSLATAYNVADTPVAQDTRIQQLAFRTDNVLSGLATFAAWLLDNGFTGTLGGDSDNDGVSDALEYFFNTNPNNPADRAHLPAVVREGGDLEFRFTRLQNSTLNGTLRYSTDLLIWQNAVQGVDFEIISQTVSSGEVSVRYRILNPINAKFFQLRVE